MAREVITKVTSDLTGIESLGDAPTLGITLDGKKANLDITAAEADAFRAALDGDMSKLRAMFAPKADAQVKRPVTRPRSHGESGEVTPGNLARAWGESNGFSVSTKPGITEPIFPDGIPPSAHPGSRGRAPAPLLAAWEAAGKPDVTATSGPEPASGGPRLADEPASAAAPAAASTGPARAAGKPAGKATAGKPAAA